MPVESFAKQPRKTFPPRRRLTSPELIQLFAWSEEEFLRKPKALPFDALAMVLLRNIAVALGMHLSEDLIHALKENYHPSALVREHGDRL